MSNQWIPFDAALGSNQCLPEARKRVLVSLEMMRDDGTKDSSLQAMACVMGYLKFGGGDPNSPYFVCHSVRGPWQARAWCDCLPAGLDGNGIPAAGSQPKPTPLHEWMTTSSPVEKVFIGDDNFESVLDKCLANDALSKVVTAYSVNHVPIGVELSTSETDLPWPWAGSRHACVIMTDIFMNFTKIVYTLIFHNGMGMNTRHTSSVWVNGMIEGTKPILEPKNKEAMKAAVRKMICLSTDSELGRLVEGSNGAKVVTVDRPPSLESKGDIPVVVARQVGPGEWEVHHIESVGIWPSWAKPGRGYSTLMLVQARDVWDAI